MKTNSDLPFPVTCASNQILSADGKVLAEVNGASVYAASERAAKLARLINYTPEIVAAAREVITAHALQPPGDVETPLDRAIYRLNRAIP